MSYYYSCSGEFCKVFLFVFLFVFFAPKVKSSPDMKMTVQVNFKNGSWGPKVSKEVIEIKTHQSTIIQNRSLRTNTIQIVHHGNYFHRTEILICHVSKMYLLINNSNYQTTETKVLHRVSAAFVKNGEKVWY